MNLLFVCGLFHSTKQEEIFAKSKIFPYMAANVHQYCIVGGLKQLEDVKIEMVNTPFVGTYPREYKDIYLKYNTWSFDQIPVHEQGGLNLFGIRTIWRTASTFREMRAWWKRLPEKSGTALLYSMITPFMLGAVLAKMSCKGMKLCIYIPDLPVHFMDNTRRKLIYRILKKLDCKLMDALLVSMDGFALLTEHMNDKVNPYMKPYAVIEGIVSDKDISAQPPIFPVDGDRKRIVYTGKTDVEFGVMELVDAFMEVKRSDFDLDIYGDGNASVQLTACMQRDSRIHWHGTVLREVALQKQRDATILVNPRNPERAFTEYSFPSKTIEYLLAGRPVVMHKLQGIPKDYEPYITWFSSTDTHDMAATLEHIAALPSEQLNEVGRKGREFLIANKNERAQGKILKQLLDRI